MKYKRIHFEPLSWISSPHFQTVVSSCLWANRAPPSKKLLADLGNGDFLLCKESTPFNWNEFDSTVVLIHGMGGSDSSNYMIRLAKKLYLQGHRVVRVNLRGAGPGKHLSKKPYHAGTSEDVSKLLLNLKKGASNSPITLIGFSLGGNITLKLAGELGLEAKKIVKTFIAVCPPLDLHSVSDRFHVKENRLYHFFYRYKIGWQSRPWRSHSFSTLREYDETVTAPMWGYKNAAEYYAECSSRQFIPSIRQSTHILLAEDDPLIGLKGLEEVSFPESVKVWLTERGGHMGFLGKVPNEKSFHWMDYLVLKWVEEDFSSITSVAADEE